MEIPTSTKRPIDRLRIFAHYCKQKKFVVSISAFETTCGLSNRYLTNMKVGAGNIGVDTVAKVYNRFPFVSTHWLCTGEGNMLAESEETTRLKNAYEETIRELFRIQLVHKELIEKCKLIG